MKRFLDKIQLEFTKTLDLREVSSLELAYVGDCVFEILVRTYLIKKSNSKVKDFHNKASKLVNAKTQAMFYKYLIENLQDTNDIEILKRGKNVKVKRTVKNSTNVEYKNATAFEAFLGDLYLKGENDKVISIFYMFIKYFENTNETLER